MMNDMISLIIGIWKVLGLASFIFMVLTHKNEKVVRCFNDEHKILGYIILLCYFPGMLLFIMDGLGWL